MDNACKVNRRFDDSLLKPRKVNKSELWENSDFSTTLPEWTLWCFRTRLRWLWQWRRWRFLWTCVEKINWWPDISSLRPDWSLQVTSDFWQFSTDIKYKQTITDTSPTIITASTIAKVRRKNSDFCSFIVSWDKRSVLLADWWKDLLSAQITGLICLQSQIFNVIKTDWPSPTTTCQKNELMNEHWRQASTNWCSGDGFPVGKQQL